MFWLHLEEQGVLYHIENFFTLFFFLSRKWDLCGLRPIPPKNIFFLEIPRKLKMENLPVVSWSVYLAPDENKFLGLLNPPQSSSWISKSSRNLCTDIAKNASLDKVSIEFNQKDCLPCVK